MQIKLENASMKQFKSEGAQVKKSLAILQRDISKLQSQISDKDEQIAKLISEQKALQLKL